MKLLDRLKTSNKNREVTIENGELISYIYEGHELIHRKNDPGWGSADTEMFPIIGPTRADDFKVDTPRGKAIQDQHGLLRELEYELVDKDGNSARFQKSYKKNTRVKNSKFPGKSSEEWLSWPFDFEFKKMFTLSDTFLKVEFEIQGEKGMPYMLGYHPAFALKGDMAETIKFKDRVIGLHEVMDVGDIAFPVLNTEKIELVSPEGISVGISTRGFNNYMLWAPVQHMICIEPITAYPYTENAGLSKDLFHTITGTIRYEVQITPF